MAVKYLLVNDKLNNSYHVIQWYFASVLSKRDKSNEFCSLLTKKLAEVTKHSDDAIF